MDVGGEELEDVLDALQWEGARLRGLEAVVEQLQELLQAGLVHRVHQAELRRPHRPSSKKKKKNGIGQ